MIPPALAAPSSTAQSAATVYVVQALSQGDVKLSVDDHSPVRVLGANDVLRPIRLTAGRHVMRFSGKSRNWTLNATVDVRAGASEDVVIHRPADAAGDPVVTTYVNDLSPIGAGKGRVVVAHTAVVPPADILVDGNVVFANIANGEFASADVPAGDLNVSVVPTGKSSPVLLGPLNLTVEAAVLTRVFAVGEPSNGSMNVIVQQLPLRAKGSGAPTALPLGSAGLVSDWNVETTQRPPAATGGGDTAALAGGALVAGASVLLVIGRLRRTPRAHRASR
jgi:hypothetical protein